MSMRIAYHDSKRAATAAFRAVTGRVARGYMPTTHVEEATSGINAGHWVLHVKITHEKPPRPSDARQYEFEIKCDTDGTAYRALEILDTTLIRAMDQMGAEKRSGKVEPIGKVLNRKYGQKK